MKPFTVSNEPIRIEVARFVWEAPPKGVLQCNELRLALGTLRRTYRELQALDAPRPILVELELSIRRIRKLVR